MAPLISIVIPTYNRATRLQTCLAALAGQSLDIKKFEVIVVVDGSTDNTAHILATLEPCYELRTFFQENSGQNVARNRGAAEARGRYCLFIDDDIIAGPELVEVHLQLLLSQPNTVGLGQISLRIPHHADPFTHYYAESWRSYFESLNQGEVTLGWQHCFGGNFSIARKAFLGSGGFASDIRRRHDIELGYRLEQQGMNFVYLTEAVGEQSDDKTVQELLADAESAGSAALVLCRRHPDMGPTLLDPYLDVGIAEAFAHRLLLALQPPTWLLMAFGRTLRHRSYARRWYRFMHRHGYRRGISRSRKGIAGLNRGTPILMYHGFGGKGAPGSRYVIPAKRFRQQMTWLKWRRFNVISLHALVARLRESRDPPPRSVVITIDDGYADALLLAEPILRRHGFSATVFVVTEQMGKSKPGAVDPLSDRPMLTEAQIKTLMSRGITIGAHSRTHPRLRDLTIEEKHYEIAGAKACLEELTERPVHYFAYPYGEHDAESQTIAADAGYWASCGIDPGRTNSGTPLHALRRIEVNGNDSLLKFMLRFR